MMNKKKKYLLHVFELKNVSPTLTTGGRLTGGLNEDLFNQIGGFAPIMVFEYENDENTDKMKYKISKLTPQQAFRLMGVNEENIKKMCSAGIVDNQLWKLAGNSIVVNVMEKVFESMFIHYKDNGHVQPLKQHPNKSEALW